VDQENRKSRAYNNNVDGQDEWIKTLADAAEETERLQKSIMDFYKSLMIISRPPRKQLSHAQTWISRWDYRIQPPRLVI